MATTSILALKSRVTLEQACRRFSTAGIRGAARRFTLGELRSVAEMYVPFDVSQVRVRNGERRGSLLLAVDAVNAGLDAYQLDALPPESDRLRIDERNVLPRCVSPEQSLQAAQDSARRLIYTSGFLRIRKLFLSASLHVVMLHVPYWVAFFGPDADLQISVMDAARGALEGAKARQLFRDFLLNARLRGTTASAGFSLSINARGGG